MGERLFQPRCLDLTEVSERAEDNGQKERHTRKLFSSRQVKMAGGENRRREAEGGSKRREKDVGWMESFKGTRDFQAPVLIAVFFFNSVTLSAHVHCLY